MNSVEAAGHWQDVASPLEGQVAWITGASQGLGREIAIGLAKAGAAVAITARSPDRLHEVAAEIEAAGGAAVPIAGSVTEQNDVRDAVRTLIAKWGRLDILVNNAGISPLAVPAEALPLEDWETLIKVNLTGAFLCCQMAHEALRAGSGGSIINVSSVHGSSPVPLLSAYSASKGGLEMLTRSLAIEWADRGIRVNAIAPGYLITPMTHAIRNNPDWLERLNRRIPMRRFATAVEIVPGVVYLASSQSSYVTGTTLHVDGGWTSV